MVNEMNITIELNPAQVAALEVMGSNDDVAALATNALASRIKGKIDNYRNGNRLPFERKSEATHTLIKNGKTIYYKGGLKETATQAFQMAKAFLPKDITQAMFVNAQLAEVDAIISTLSAKGEGVSDSEDVDELEA
jgi:hypothetical protein